MRGRTGRASVGLGAGEPVGGIHGGGLDATVAASRAPMMVGIVHRTETEMDSSLVILPAGGVDNVVGVGAGVDGGVGLPSEPIERVGSPGGEGIIPPMTATSGIRSR